MSGEWTMTIAAGGTGGHISPALAIAEHLRESDPSCLVQFVCGKRKVEIEVYFKAEIEPRTLDVEPLARGPFGWLANVRNLMRSLAAARRYLKTERPEVVVGMGGYVCVPVVQAAAMQGVPTMIHEQNSVAGRANRWLGRWVRAVACAYPEAANAFPPAKVRITGNPVRSAAVGYDRQEALREWNLRDEVPTVLLFGGSQGARRLNEIMLDALEPLDRAAAGLGGLQILWACGERNHEEVRAQLDSKRLERLTVRLKPFIRNMGSAYAAADLAIGRAGAMTLAELTANALPAIVVPLPGATSGHQRRNAQPLAEAGAMMIVDEDDLDVAKVSAVVMDLFSDQTRLEKMWKSCAKVARPRAAEEIVRIIFEIRGELA